MAEITITKENFETEVMQSELPVLIDFWASWCGPCRMLAPTIEALAKDYDGKVKVGKVNVDNDPELADRFRIVSIPTVVLMKNGQVVATTVGVQPRSKFDELLK